MTELGRLQSILYRVEIGSSGSALHPRPSGTAIADKESAAVQSSLYMGLPLKEPHDLLVFHSITIDNLI